MPQEFWNQALGYEGSYEVSNHGRVKSVTRIAQDGKIIQERVLRQKTMRGYKHVGLSVGGIAKTVAVHRLVLEAFVGPCPEGMEACHFDGDPSNNHIANLRWDTHRENMLDRARQGKVSPLRRSHCSLGHELSGGNLIHRRGSLFCRACERERKSSTKRGREFSKKMADLQFESILNRS